MMTPWARPIETGWLLAGGVPRPPLSSTRGDLDRLLAKDYRPVRDVVAAYEVDGPDGTALGILCLVAPAAVWRSEDVYPRIVAERAARLLGLGRATSAAMLVPAAGGEALTAAVAEAVGARQPQVRTRDVLGRTHRLWLVEEHTDLLVAVGRQPLLVADGNHRLAAATSADVPLLALVTAGPDLRIGAIHRALTGTGLTAADLAAAWRRAGLTVLDRADPRPPAEPGVVTVPGGLVVELPAPGEPAPRIDHDLAEQVLVADALGIDPDGPHVRAVPAGQPPGPDADALLQLAPVSFADVLTMHDQRRRMPRKCTYFTPKPVGGLLIADLPA